MWLFEIIGAMFFGLFLFVLIGAIAVYLDYKKENEMGARLSATLDGEPPKRKVEEKKDWVVGLEKLGVQIYGVEGYESELRRELRELMSVTLPKIGEMDVSEETREIYANVVRGEMERVIVMVNEERARKERDDMDYLMRYGLGDEVVEGERVKN
jgi:hypothetical protein